MQTAKAGPSRLPMEGKLGISYKGEPRYRTGLTAEMVETLTSFIEVVIHSILCIRGVYPATTFTRRRAHGVPVYQSRHPDVRGYVAKVVSALQKELEKGTLRRTTLVIRSVETSLPLERFIVDFGYMAAELSAPQREAKIQNAPTADDLSLMLRAFLIRLMALDGQLLDCKGETTFAIVVETKDDLEPAVAEGTTSPWVPALAGDTLNTTSAITGHHEPLLSVRAVETGVIDLRMVVQECTAKTGVDQLDV